MIEANRGNLTHPPHHILRHPAPRCKLSDYILRQQLREVAEKIEDGPSAPVLPGGDGDVGDRSMEPRNLDDPGGLNDLVVFFVIFEKRTLKSNR